jgi:hypothetical protein
VIFGVLERSESLLESGCLTFSSRIALNSRFGDILFNKILGWLSISYESAAGDYHYKPLSIENLKNFNRRKRLNQIDFCFLEMGLWAILSSVGS